MKYAIKLFHALVDSTKSAELIYTHMNEMMGLIDCSDLLRWQWVQAVSALDKFIHDIVRIGMIEIFNERRIPTEKYKKFMISLETLNLMLLSKSVVDRSRLVEEQILQHNGYKAFQRPEKISDALAYIWDEQHKWREIANKMLGTPKENDVKTQLNNIIIRRDQIVHNGDCQTETFPLVRQNIVIEDVEITITFIKNVVQSIYDCIIAI